MWAKEEGSSRDLEIFVSPTVGGGGAKTPFCPLPGKWGERPLAPLFLRLCDWFSNEVCVELRSVSVHLSQLVPTATDQDWTCPTGTDWQQRDSARHNWLYTLGRLPVTDGWVELGWVWSAILCSPIALTIYWLLTCTVLCSVLDKEACYVSRAQMDCEAIKRYALHWTGHMTGGNVVAQCLPWHAGENNWPCFCRKNGSSTVKNVNAQ